MGINSVVEFVPKDLQNYTYRAGNKILLEKRPDEFIVRASPDKLETIGITGAE
ncbi:MAG: hypothetical protein QG610_2033 [Euryarchaeota archaeon]|nr:hypothetical protein [Euryarchaeota archaeon]